MVQWLLHSVVHHWLLFTVIMCRCAHALCVSFALDMFYVLFTAVIGVTHVMFRETESTLEGEVGTRGTIVSPFYPLPIDSVILSHLHRTSTLLLTACPECRISLTFTNVSLPECDLNEYDYRSIPSSDYCSQA